MAINNKEGQPQQEITKMIEQALERERHDPLMQMDWDAETETLKYRNPELRTAAGFGNTIGGYVHKP